MEAPEARGDIATALLIRRCLDFFLGLRGVFYSPKPPPHETLPLRCTPSVPSIVISRPEAPLKREWDDLSTKELKRKWQPERTWNEASQKLTAEHDKLRGYI